MKPEFGNPVSILMLAADPVAQVLGEALGQALSAQIQYATDLRQCHEILQGGGLSMLLLEEAVAWENGTAVDALYKVAGSTLILEVNCGICTAERLVRQVKSALSRRHAQDVSIRMAVMNSLQSELNASVSGLLLESQMALRNSGPQFAPSLQHLVTLAEALCAQLRP